MTATYEIRALPCPHCDGQGSVDAGERGIDRETGAAMHRLAVCDACGGRGSDGLFEVFRNGHREMSFAIFETGTLDAAREYVRQAAEDDDMRARDDAYGGPYNTREPD